MLTFTFTRIPPKYTTRVIISTLKKTKKFEWLCLHLIKKKMENDTLTWTVTGNGSFLYTCVFRTVHCVVWFTNCIVRMFSWFFDWQFACELASGETWLNTCAKTIQPQIRTKWQETGRKMVSCNEVLSLKGTYSIYRIAPNSKEMKLITLNWYHGDEMEDFCLWL